MKMMIRKYNTMLTELLHRTPTMREMLYYAADGVWDYLRYGSTVTDYFELTFHAKTAAEKKTYATWRDSKRLIYLADPPDRLERLRSKTKMYLSLPKFVKREILFTSQCSFDAFLDFISRHPVFMYKPDKESCGRGICMMDTAGYNPRTLFDEMTEQPAILDELIVQHPHLQALCAKSVNTLRIFSMRINGEVTVMTAALRMGRGTTVIDNYSAGGLVGAVDLETGRLLGDAEDAMGVRYREHPASHIVITGFQVPLWNEVLHFVTDCAKACELNYAAWDVAVRERDCCLVEVNPMGMVNLVQIAGNGGKRELYQRLYRELKEAQKK